MIDADPWSYGRVLRQRRLSALLAGNAISYAGNGMIIISLPLLTLEIHGSIAPAIAIALVESAPFVLAMMLAFAIGMGRLSVAPRTLLIIDCVLRPAVLGVLGILAMTHRLSLGVLIGGLLVGSVFRMVASSGRRLLATGMVPAEGRFAVNGLLGTSENLALYVIGPVIGAVVAVSTDPGLALLVDALASVILLTIVLATVPTRPAAAAAGAEESGSGWRILRRTPIVARLLVVVIFVVLFYMPVEVALPLLVKGPLHASGATLGLLWGAFGLCALLGSAASNYLRRLPQHALLVAIIGAWGVAVLVLALAPTVPIAVAERVKGLRPVGVRRSAVRSRVAVGVC